jgi:hypothetical protein
MLFSLFAMAHAADRGISVDSPYLVSIWKCGTELSIIWNKWGDWTQQNQDPGNQKVRILLRKDAPPRTRVLPKLIADNVPALSVTGSYKWKIAANTANGEYHVIVETINKQFRGESQIFSIEGCRSLGDHIEMTPGI